MVRRAIRKNPNFQEGLVHPTLAGIYVRSKSEAMIAQVLFTNDIPFKYECPLILDDTTFYPDFTIMHPKTGEIIYLEHFGLMDESNYRGMTVSKLKKYILHNIIPDINLITTYETHDKPLSFITIQEKLRMMGLID